MISTFHAQKESIIEALIPNAIKTQISELCLCGIKELASATSESGISSAPLRFFALKMICWTQQR